MFSKSQDNSGRKDGGDKAKPTGQRSGAFAEIVGAPAPTIISVDMRISGDMRTDGDVQIDGVVDGDVQSSTVSVGKTAEVNGEVVADKVRVWGRVNGRIRGKEISLMETAEVNGDIVHESLEINRGAFIDGIVKRSVKEDAKPVKVDLVAGAKLAGATEVKSAEDKAESEAQTGDDPAGKTESAKAKDAASADAKKVAAGSGD